MRIRYRMLEIEIIFFVVAIIVKSFNIIKCERGDKVKFENDFTLSS